MKSIALAFAMAGAISTSLIAQAPLTPTVSGRNNDDASMAAQRNFLAVSWGASLAGVQDVFVAIRRNGGTSFGETVRVNALVGDARVGGEQPPHVVLVPLAATHGRVMFARAGRRSDIRSAARAACTRV